MATRPSSVMEVNLSLLSLSTSARKHKVTPNGQPRHMKRASGLPLPLPAFGLLAAGSELIIVASRTCFKAPLVQQRPGKAKLFYVNFYISMVHGVWCWPNTLRSLISQRSAIRFHPVSPTAVLLRHHTSTLFQRTPVDT
jgi:hypothetical protein